MSDINLDAIVKERDSLKAQLETQQTNGQAQVDNLLNQVQANKGMLDDTIALALNLRTNLHAFQNALQKAQQENEASKKQIVSLNQQLSDATVKIAEMSVKLAATEDQAA